MSSRITPELVLHAYCQGAFPMGRPGGGIEWYSPDPRCIFPLDAFHVPDTLRKTIRRGVFEVRVNTAFERVLAACATGRVEGTWITKRIADLYMHLHHEGFAHSVETWKHGELAGGLYGVAIGAAFFGESMFHRVTDASKVALVALVEQMRSRDYRLLDTQWNTPHLARFGARDVSRDEYLARLNEALRLPRRFTDQSPPTGVMVEE